MIASLLVTYQAWRTAYKDVGILLAGISLYIISFAVFIFMYKGLLPNAVLLGDFYWIDFFYHFSVVCVPVSLSIYLAQEFAFTSKELERKLSEVQQLSEEKQQILISQKEMLEQQVTQRTEELKQSLEELKATQAQLIQQEKMASLGELTAGIAHEIQNPLNFINNFSETNTELVDELQQEADKGNLDEVKQLAHCIKENEGKILHHGKRADNIVKGMLQHSRGSAGEKQATDINALTEEYLRLSFHGFRGRDKAFSTTIETHFDNTIGMVSVVPQEIGRVLLNLFNNAFYAVQMKKQQLNGTFEPWVSVSTKREHNNIVIAVKDNGTGMPQKVAKKVFQPFFTTKPAGEGTGLGLSLSYDIITKGHGGELTVESKEGEYTTFVIGLPLTSAENTVSKSPIVLL